MDSTRLVAVKLGELVQRKRVGYKRAVRLQEGSLADFGKEEQAISCVRSHAPACCRRTACWNEISRPFVQSDTQSSGLLRCATAAACCACCVCCCA